MYNRLFDRMLLNLFAKLKNLQTIREPSLIATSSPVVGVAYS